MSKKIVFIIITCLLVFFSFQPATSLAAKSLKQIRQEKQEVNSELSDAENQLAQLVNEMKDLNSEIHALNDSFAQNRKALEDVRKEKTEVQKEIDVLQAKIDERFVILNERMKSYQEIGGNISYLEVILGAKSFTDFISRLHAITKITDSDAALMTEQRKDKEKFDRKMDEMNDLEAELKEMEELIAEQKAEAEALKDELDEKKKRLEKLVKQLKKEAKELAELEAEIFEEPAKVSAGMLAGNGLLGWPAVGGYISSYYGKRWGKLHKGIDIARTNRSTKPAILAAEAGVVEVAGYHQRGYGNQVIIDHGNGLKTLYAHLDSITVQAGDRVKRGDKIGIMGATGNSTGIHLHFEVHENGEVKNPIPYLR